MPEHTLHARQLADPADPATEQAIAEIVARAPEMTEEQAAKIRRMFRYGPADGESPGAETGASTLSARRPNLALDDDPRKEVPVSVPRNTDNALHAVGDMDDITLTADARGPR